MSSIVTDQGVVHYEVAGRGHPVILLHGWLGSWGYWAETMARLQGSYRTYALDFWGFGDSNKHSVSFQVDTFTELVEQFMERMGIEAAPVIGHSMGGTVSLNMAINYPQRVKKVAVVGSPVNGKSLSFWLKLAGEPWAANLLWKIPYSLKIFLRLFSYGATKESERWYKMVTRDVSSTTMDSFFSSIRSLHHTDLTNQLSPVKVPVMGVYGQKDIIVQPTQGDTLKHAVPHAQIVSLPGSGHFPMLDEPEVFHQHLSDFLSQS